MPSLADLEANVRALSADDRKRLAIRVGQTLSAEDQRDVAQSLGLPSPSQRVANNIWMIVVGAFAFVLVGAFAAIAGYIYLGKTVDTLLTVFTTVAAFLGGLLVPSPVASPGPTR